MDYIVIGAGIILALLFNFVNGLNDAANSIATIVATKALTPLKAVGLAAVFNLVGPLVFTTAIARTIGKGIVDPVFLSPSVLLAAMAGAVIWVFFTSYFGIPISSSHALVGGLMGAGIAAAGIGAVIWPSSGAITTVGVAICVGAVAGALILPAIAHRQGDPWRKYTGIGALVGVTLTIPLLIIAGFLHMGGVLAVVIFIVISPMLGMISAYTVGILITRTMSQIHPSRVNGAFRYLQILAGSFQAIGHGSNDAQNAMGVITAILVAGGLLTDFVVPIWVILVSCLAISLGTLFGGWRVVEMMANKITKIHPYQGFSASTAGGAVLSLMTSFGVPVSTTHAMAGSIMGAGATRGYSAVKWGVVREIVAAWILTIPASAMISGLCYLAYLGVVGV